MIAWYGINIWCPRSPAETAMTSHSVQVSSINVGYFFFIAIGLQPPRIYPVTPSSSLTGINSILLSLAALAAFLRLSSQHTGIQKMFIPVLAPRATSVLNTCSEGSPIAFAAWSKLEQPEIYSQMSALCDFTFNTPSALEHFLFE